MKTHIEITKEIMEMVEDYSMAGIDEKTLEVRIKNLLLVWSKEVEDRTKDEYDNDKEGFFYDNCED